jgi:hypothetical protein
MTDKASRKTPAINHKSVERFENEGGATRAGELSRKKRPRDMNQLAKLIVEIGTGQVEDRALSQDQGSKQPPKRLRAKRRTTNR